MNHSDEDWPSRDEEDRPRRAAMRRRGWDGRAMRRMGRDGGK